MLNIWFLNDIFSYFVKIRFFVFKRTSKYYTCVGKFKTFNFITLLIEVCVNFYFIWLGTFLFYCKFIERYKIEWTKMSSCLITISQFKIILQPCHWFLLLQMAILVENMSNRFVNKSVKSLYEVIKWRIMNVTLIVFVAKKT